MVFPSQHHPGPQWDPRGPIMILGPCPFCDSWTLEYVSCDDQRDLVDDVLEEHVRGCNVNWQALIEEWAKNWRDKGFSVRDFNKHIEGGGLDERE